MLAQGGVDPATVLVTVGGQQLGALFETQPLGAVAAVVGGVAACLVRQQRNVDVVVDGVLQQVDDVAVVRDRDGGALGDVLLRQGEDLVEVLGDVPHPALVQTGLDARHVHLGDDADGVGDLGGLGLGAGHAAQARGDEQHPGQVAVVGDTQLQTSGVEDGVEGAVHDALRADVHPSAGGHLAVVGDPELLAELPVVLVVEATDHEPIGDDDAWGLRARREQAQRVSTHDDQGGVLGELLKVLLDESVLQPVVAHRPGLAIGDELVGIQRDVEVEVVVDLHLEGLALGAPAFVLVDGTAFDVTGWAPPIGVDAAVGAQLLEELRSSLFMQF